MTRNEHHALRRRIGPYLDGESDEAGATRVRQHLAECWTCSEEAEWLLLIKAALRQLALRRPRDVTITRLSRFTHNLLAKR